jgi:hypothetical protein
MGEARAAGVILASAKANLTKEWSFPKMETTAPHGREMK